MFCNTAILSTMIIGFAATEEDFEESGQGGIDSNIDDNEKIVIHTITASTTIQSSDYTANVSIKTSDTIVGDREDDNTPTLLNNSTYTTAILYEDDENTTTSTQVEEKVWQVETTMGYNRDKVTEDSYATGQQSRTEISSQSMEVHEVTLSDSPMTSISPYRKQSKSTTPTPDLYNSTQSVLSQRAKHTTSSIYKVFKGDTTTGNSSATQTTQAWTSIPLLASSSTTALWLNNSTTKYIHGVYPQQNGDILPIVGVVCAILGILIGIIISAGLWYHLNKAKLRERKISKHSTIEKNPREKTFERLDFNLTLPTNADCENSVIDLTDDEHKRGTYESFESGLYHGELIQIHANSMYSEPGTDEFQIAHNQETENEYPSIPDDYAPELSNQRTLPFTFQRSANVTPKPSMMASYSALLQQDSSDQSTISSSQRYGNSNCGTYLTDLPDSDGSNSSTCGGPVSVASSVNKERIYRPDIGSSERKLYFIPTRQSSVVEKDKSKPVDESLECVDMQLQQLTRISSFSSEHSCSPGLEDDVPNFLTSEHGTKYESGKGNLSYLDVKNINMNVDSISLDNNDQRSISYIYEPPDLQSSNSENTINL